MEKEKKQRQRDRERARERASGERTRVLVRRSEFGDFGKVQARMMRSGVFFER